MTVNADRRSIAAIVAQSREDLTAFVHTRFELFMSELHEKTHMFKKVVPLAGLSLILLGTAYVLFLVALVALVAILLQSGSFPWLFACLIVAGLTAILGLLAAYLAKNALQTQGLLPTKTIAVLKADKIWLQAQVNNQI